MLASIFGVFFILVKYYAYISTHFLLGLSALWYALSDISTYQPGYGRHLNAIMALSNAPDLVMTILSIPIFIPLYMFMRAWIAKAKQNK